MSVLNDLLKIGAFSAVGLFSTETLADRPKLDFDPEVYLNSSDRVTPQTKASPESSGRLVDPELYLGSNGGPTDQYKQQLGEVTQYILRDACERVDYRLINHDGGKDLLITCYEYVDEHFKAGWVLNADNTCRIYAKISYFLGMKSRAKLIAQLSRGEISSKEMGVRAAEKLVNLLGKYVQNNAQRCKDWREHYQKNYGPLGPITNE